MERGMKRQEMEGGLEEEEISFNTMQPVEEEERVVAELARPVPRGPGRPGRRWKATSTKALSAPSSVTR